jgi:hypothetical protein
LLSVRSDSQELVATYMVRTGRYDATARPSSLPRALLDTEEVLTHLPV